MSLASGSLGSLSDSTFFSHGSISFTTWHRPYMLLIEVRDPITLIPCRVHADPCSKLLEMLPTVLQRLSRQTIQARLDGSRRPRNFASRMYYCMPLSMLSETVCVSYWDWAEPRVEQEGLPPVFYEPKLQITVARGQIKEIDNPLAFYTYQAPIPPDFQDETNPQVCLK